MWVPKDGLGLKRGQMKLSKREELGKCESQETWLPNGMHDIEIIDLRFTDLIYDIFA